MDDLLADFLTETNESLAELDVAVVRLEAVPNDAATLSLIFRLVHTIKGTCGFLGLPRLEKVAHAAENILGLFRDGALPVTPGAITLILRALDRIKRIVGDLEATQSEPAGDDSELIAALNAAASGQPIDVVAAQAHEPEPVLDFDAVEAPPPPVAAVAAPPRPIEEAKPAPAPAPAAASGDEHEGGAQKESAVASQTIRVNVEVLEDLMTLVSELVLARNQLMQLVRTQENSPFQVPLQRLSHITSDLQEGVMKLRMQPIGNAWNKLPRIVRDLSRDMGKKIELVMLGAETELDRQVLEFIKDPLTHMVRNSGDHGLEGPEARRAAGKPETGRITLNAFHEGGHIIIEIADDGRGLPIERIKAKVLGNGLATEAELAQMTENQIQQFIFRAGFSTAAQVTAVSGRGVGMDVVKTNIEKIGGTISLTSIEGKGTTFTIKIPLTLAIVSALIVECGGERFAIPQISVLELVRANGSGDTVIEHINATPVLRLRDRLLPLVSLNGLLQLAPQDEEKRENFIVVTQVGSLVFGIIVDRVFDTEEIVVKPVAPILRHITMFSGNTILGDGSVIMILDPNGIARATGAGRGPGAGRSVDNGKVETDQGSNEKTALLLFRAGGPEPKAVPLGLVARLEDIERTKIENSGGRPVVQYRGKLMPLVGMDGGFSGSAGEGDRQPLLVFSEGLRAMGLIVDEIVDVVEDRLEIELGSDRPGFLGSAVIAGKATDVIDTGFWLKQAYPDWFVGPSAQPQGAARILVVDDSAFFRQLVGPMLKAAGYAVTSVPGPNQALKLREQGVLFDAIVTDIEMPDMNGFVLAQTIRSGGPWAQLPLIALTGHASPDAIERGREAGFTDYVAKFDRDALIATIGQCVSVRSTLANAI